MLTPATPISMPKLVTKKHRYGSAIIGNLCLGFKDCPVCHEIKKLVCSKASCRVDGMKPIMIKLAPSTKTKPNYKVDLIDEERDNFDSGNILLL